MLKNLLSDWKNYGLIALVALAVLQLTHPKTITKTVTVEKVRTEVKVETVEKEKIVYRDRAHNVVRTVVKPDGTRITTKTHDTDKSVIDDTSKAKSISNISEASKSTAITEIKSTQTKYLLGISNKAQVFQFGPEISIVGGVRMGGLPIFATFSANLKREFTLGILMEF